jgi:hypothetical protein
MYMTTDNLSQSMVDQLGVYYDLRYLQYYKRSSFIADLSNYNDEIVEKIEVETVEDMKKHLEYVIKDDIESLEADPVMKLLSKRFPSLRIQELLICMKIIETEWDIGDAPYSELVARLIPDCPQLFYGLKHIQDTIQGLVHQGIVFQKLGHVETKPYIYLTLSPELEQEGFKAMSGSNLSV